MDVNAHRANVLFNSSINASTSMLTPINGASIKGNGVPSSATAQSADPGASFQAVLQAIDQSGVDGVVAGINPSAVPASTVVETANPASAKSVKGGSADLQPALGSDLLAAQHVAQASMSAAVTVNPTTVDIKSAAADFASAVPQGHLGYQVGPNDAPGAAHHARADGASQGAQLNRSTVSSANNAAGDTGSAAGTQSPGRPISAAQAAAAWAEYDASLDASGSSTAMRSWQMGFVDPANMTTDQLKSMVQMWNDAAAQRNDMLQNLLPDGSMPMPAQATIYEGLVQDAQAQAAPYAAELRTRGIS